MTRTEGSAAFGLPETLEGRSAFTARAAWILLAGVLVPLTTWGLVRVFQNPELVAVAPLTNLFVELGFDARVMIALALALPFYAVVVIASYVFFARPNDPVALTFSAALLTTFSASSRAFEAFDGFPIMQYAYDVVFVLTALSLVLLFGLFPNGKLAPRWAWAMGPLMLFALLLNPRMATTVMTALDGGTAISLREHLAIAMTMMAVGIGLAAQFHRYRHISTVEEQQQTKLVSVPLGLFVGLLLTALVALAFSPDNPGTWIGWILLAWIPAALATPLGLAAAVLRYRLFEVDRLISRTVTYTLVVVLLGLVFALGVVWIPTLLGLGDASPLLVAASTLAVAALFNPLRRRVQDAVDRRFNRTSYRVEQVSNELTGHLQHTLNAKQIADTWAETVNRYFEPAAFGVWINENANGGGGGGPE